MLGISFLMHPFHVAHIVVLPTTSTKLILGALMDYSVPC